MYYNKKGILCNQIISLTLITPGQFGPTRRDLFCDISLCRTTTISFKGMPSVMHTINGISAAKASRIAADAAGAGTYITVAVAPVFLTA